jgi:hypothetical protein
MVATDPGVWMMDGRKYSYQEEAPKGKVTFTAVAFSTSMGTTKKSGPRKKL